MNDLSVLLETYMFVAMCLQIRTEISVFEFNIRFIGGLLSAYSLSGDEVSGQGHLTHTDTYYNVLHYEYTHHISIPHA